MKFDANNIPDELKMIPQWMGSKIVVRNGKNTKPPVDYRNGYMVDKTNASLWEDFNTLITKLDKHSLDMVGFVTSNNGADYSYVVIDLDKCIDDNNVINAQAAEIIDICNSYTEYSVSRKGIHIILKLPVQFVMDIGGANFHYGEQKIELIKNNNFIIITGYRYENTPRDINVNEEAIKRLLDVRISKTSDSKSNNNLLASSKSRKDIVPPYKEASFADDYIIRRCAHHQKDGDAFRKLYIGGDISISSTDQDESNADFHLLCILARHTRCNFHQMKRIFERSALYKTLGRKVKPDQYLTISINSAIEKTRSY